MFVGFSYGFRILNPDKMSEFFYSIQKNYILEQFSNQANLQPKLFAGLKLVLYEHHL